MKRLSGYAYLIVAFLVVLIFVASSVDWSTVAASTTAALARLRAARASDAKYNPAQPGPSIRYPGNLIQGSDGYTYGVATTIEDQQNNGTAKQWGAVLRFSESGELHILHSFNHTDGALPAGSLFETRDGFLYGVTSEGGSYDG